jgi:hypothetical protein
MDHNSPLPLKSADFQCEETEKKLETIGKPINNIIARPVGKKNQKKVL